jgi:hypothetical protein
MKKFSGLNLLAMVVFIYSILGCTTKPPNRQEEDVIDLSILATDTSAVRDFRWEVFCSETKLRTGVVSLTWRTDAHFFDKQRLDITVYKGGFEKDLYTILWPLKKDQKFRTSRRVKLPNRSSNQSLYLNVEEINVDTQKNLVSTKLDGLEPGLNYFCRVLTLDKKGWIPGKIVRWQAPICPADIEEK